MTRNPHELRQRNLKVFHDFLGNHRW